MGDGGAVFEAALAFAQQVNLAGLVNATTNTAVDTATNKGKSNSGNYFTDTFTRTGTAIANSWTATNTGTGNWATDGSDLYWTNGTATATEFDVCPTVGASDAVGVGVVLDNPVVASGAIQELWTRSDGTTSNGVKIQWDGANLSLWKVVSGTATQLGSNVAYVPKAGDHLLLVPVGTTREFLVYLNGDVVIDQTDTVATLSNVGSSYRKGAIYASATSTAYPGSLHSFTLHDDAVPTTGVGSYALVTRHATGNTNVGTNGSNAVVPNNYWDTLVSNTPDITVDMTTGKFTFSRAGVYIATVKVFANGGGVENFCAALFKGGTVFQLAGKSVCDPNNTNINNDAYGLFVFQITAADISGGTNYVQAGIGLNAVTSIGDSTGTKTYFTVTGVSRSGF